MATLNLLYKSQLPINDDLKITIPTVGDILECEDEYYSMVSMLTAMPYDMMVQLDELGIDFTTINEYDLFLRVFGSLREKDTSLIFGELDLRGFEPTVNPENGMIVYRDSHSGIVVDRGIQVQISQAIRKIHHLERNNRTPGNEEAKKFLLEREKKKLARKRRNKFEDSQLEGLITALVNTEQFKYGFEDVRNLTIYQFNESVRQIIKKIDFDNRMHGIYAGTISAKDMSQDDLNWLVHK